MHVLVVGGAGYIGSVTVDEIVNAGHQVTVMDDLSYGHQASLNPQAKFVQGTTADPAALERAFHAPVHAVVHFAAYIQVGESMQEPGRYFQNNVAGTIALLNTMLRHGVKRF